MPCDSNSSSFDPIDAVRLPVALWTALRFVNVRRNRIGPGRPGSFLALAAACVALLGAAAPSPASADEVGWLYDPNTVVELDLGLSQAAIQELAAEPDEYVNGTFRVEVGGVLQGPALPKSGSDSRAVAAHSDRYPKSRDSRSSLTSTLTTRLTSGSRSSP